jgi:hypothetical protein
VEGSLARAGHPGEAPGAGPEPNHFARAPAFNRGRTWP